MDGSLSAELLARSGDKSLQSLCPREIALDLDLRNKRRALEVASTLVERSLGLHAAPVLRALLRRRKPDRRPCHAAWHSAQTFRGRCSSIF